MRALFILFAISVFSALAADPHFGSSTFIAGAGVALPVSGYKTYAYHSGASFAGEYEFGLHKYLAATVGVENMLLNYDNFSRFGVDVTSERVTLVPFGLRAVLPLPSARTELFAGTGGALIRGSAYDLSTGGSADALWHLNGGARFTLDHAGHFRLGPTARYYRDLGRPIQQWVSLTADFSFRF